MKEIILTQEDPKGESYLGDWVFTYYVLLPGRKLPFMVKTTATAMAAMAQIWQKSGYKIEWK